MSEYFQDTDYSFVRRMDSSVNPKFLEPAAYYMGLNITSRGGIPQTRPGNATVFNAPEGHLQGITTFRPTGGKWHLVWAVGGEIYASAEPFRSYRKIKGLQFYKRSKFVSFAECVQSTDYTASGDFYQKDNPRKILMIQDGNTRAGFWDGGTSGHINPTPSWKKDGESGEIITQPGRDGTPIGLWMAWAENRLWVSNGSRVYASDIGNPLKFTEQTYLAEGRYFTMPEEVTGMIQPSSGQPLIVFGERTMTFIKAYTQRDQWIDDSEFQRTQWGVGCVAPRSIINQLGLIWFYSANGWTNLNYAIQSQVDSRIHLMDKPMGVSKKNLSADKTTIAAASIEDYMLVSVPSGGRYNEHTWVYDASDINPGWDGVWTGIRPVQWCKAVINGTERLFCASVDADGVNRIWEAMQPSRKDNGQPITCAIWTRMYNRQEGQRNSLVKRFGYFDLSLREVLGTVDVAGFVTGNTGGFERLLTTRLNAGADAITNNRGVTNTGAVTSVIPQVRHIKSRIFPHSSAEQRQVELPRRFGVDTDFQILVVWSGRLGIDSLRCFYTMGDDDRFEGRDAEDEVESIYVADSGESGVGVLPAASSLPEFTATANLTVDVDGESTPGQGTAWSVISEADAQRKAEGAARLHAWANYRA